MTIKLEKLQDIRTALGAPGARLVVRESYPNKVYFVEVDGNRTPCHGRADRLTYGKDKLEFTGRTALELFYAPAA